ncbi:hypothetical protein C2G38_1342827 [Gigaspora rosea]|uniref:Uncharacterized protein n=1 Tax=Gigaspora rosea TaxID=44941 RepID=A0A397V9D9_9GLOM|nr:hypothetical protein C2G38_1342827 [Gigaspora rosea]
MCRRPGHLACNCPNQMRRERSEHCVKVSKNRKTSISIRDKWKKRKNDTYLDDDVDAGFLRSVNAKDERKFSTSHQRAAEVNNKWMELRRIYTCEEKSRGSRKHSMKEKVKDNDKRQENWRR